MSAKTVGQDVLDNPAWAALLGPHARFAEVRGQAARYQTEVAPWHALADVRDPDAWADLAALVGPGAADVPEMLGLVRGTQPGPFRQRTVEMGTYLGLRRAGRLVAMAGERRKRLTFAAFRTAPGQTGVGSAATVSRRERSRASVSGSGRRRRAVTTPT